MSIFKSIPDKLEPNWIKTIKRWSQTVTSHFLFFVFLGAIHSLSFLPMAALFVLFFQTGGLIFLVASIPAAGISGGVWAAVHATVRELQFDFPVYLFQSFWNSLRQNFKQGAAFGVLLALLWVVLGLPVLLAQLLGEAMPFGLVCVTAIGIVLLLVLSEYSFYQIGRWILPLSVIVKNSVYLLFKIGWPSIVVAAIWILFYCGLLFFPAYLLPICLFLGLSIFLCLTCQAFYVPRLEALMEDAGE